MIFSFLVPLLRFLSGQYQQTGEPSQPTWYLIVTSLVSLIPALISAANFGMLLFQRKHFKQLHKETETLGESRKEMVAMIERYLGALTQVLAVKAPSPLPLQQGQPAPGAPGATGKKKRHRNRRKSHVDGAKNAHNLPAVQHGVEDKYFSAG